MNKDEVLNFGLYRTHKFNDIDKSLRDAGFYCEQLFSVEDFPRVLRQIAKKEPPLPNLYKFAIYPADEVIIVKDEPGEDNMSGRFALYMQIEGRISEGKPLSPLEILY